MTRTILWLAGVCLTIQAASALAIDRVKLIEGTPVQGKIIAMTPANVTIEATQVRKDVPTNTIESIEYEDEPRQLKQVRVFINAQRWADAITQLKEIDKAEATRPEIKQDLDFYEAYATAKLAMAGGEAEKLAAGKLLLAVEKATGNYHYLQVCEALGDLLVAMKRNTAADTYYAKLALAPWPDYKMKSNVLIARSMLDGGNSAGAIQKFDEVLSTAGSGKDVDRQKLAATLGKATAMAGAGQTEPAIKLVEEVIAQADPENRELHARAYNVLGTCQVKAGKKKEALMAFLHVDVLYSGYADQHAEALSYLATLWADAEKTERANQARSTLRAQYPNSPWAQK